MPIIASREINVQLGEDHAACSGGSIPLSALDLASFGRATPLIWFFEQSIDTDQLVSALSLTLASYPVLCGRYDQGPNPSAVVLNNTGVPVTIASSDEACFASFGHIPTSSTEPSHFGRAVHEPYVPEKEGMDPDAGSPFAPLLKIKITAFLGGGTAIGMLAQHGVVDAEAQIAFFTNWSRVYRGLELDPAPIHDRTLFNALSTGDQPAGEKPAVNFKALSVPVSDMTPPAFAPVMPLISGSSVVVVPFTQARLAAMMEAAKADVPEVEWFSKDDLLSALVWQALIKVRCGQVGLRVDSDELTTLSRAFNVRQRTLPKLGAGFFGNAATQMWTELPVSELCCSLSPAAVAVRLRRTITSHTPEHTAARVQWYKAEHAKGHKTPQPFDPYALTLVVSSWCFDWEAVDFGAAPVCFDHGALTPIVVNFVPRPRGDGLNVYMSGPPHSTEQFAGLLAA